MIHYKLFTQFQNQRNLNLIEIASSLSYELIYSVNNGTRICLVPAILIEDISHDASRFTRLAKTVHCTPSERVAYIIRSITDHRNEFHNHHFLSIFSKCCAHNRLRLQQPAVRVRLPRLLHFNCNSFSSSSTNCNNSSLHSKLSRNPHTSSTPVNILR